MTVNQFPAKTMSLGLCVRSDGETFDINASVLKLPRDHDYWAVVYDARHEQWGLSRFALLIPKGSADALPPAETLVETTALKRVMARLKSAGRNGVDVGYSVSPDGWFLL